MGGGFGGKESQPALLSLPAAVLAHKTQRPLKLRLDRDVDMVMTGKRHDFLADYEVGFDAAGQILALNLMLASRCGFLGGSVRPGERSGVVRIDSASFSGTSPVASHRMQDATVSNTAFRLRRPARHDGHRGIIDDIARSLTLDPSRFGVQTSMASRHAMSLTMASRVEDNVIGTCVDELARSRPL